MTQAETNKSTDVSIKDLFERVVALETKLDLMGSNNLKDVRFFKGIVYLFISIEIFNVLLNSLIILKQWR